MNQFVNRFTSARAEDGLDPRDFTQDMNPGAASLPSFTLPPLPDVRVYATTLPLNGEIEFY